MKLLTKKTYLILLKSGLSFHVEARDYESSSNLQVLSCMGITCDNKSEQLLAGSMSGTIPKSLKCNLSAIAYISAASVNLTWTASLFLYDLLPVSITLSL